MKSPQARKAAGPEHKNVGLSTTHFVAGDSLSASSAKTLCGLSRRLVPITSPVPEEDLRDPPDSVCAFCWDLYRKDAALWANKFRAPVLAGMRIKVHGVCGCVSVFSPPDTNAVLWITDSDQLGWVEREDVQHDYSCPMTCGGLLAWVNAEMSERAAYNPAIMPILHTLDATHVWNDEAVRDLVERVEAVLLGLSRRGGDTAPT